MVLYYVKISIIFYCFILCKNLFLAFFLSSFCLLCSYLKYLVLRCSKQFFNKQLRNTGLTAYRKNISQIIQHTQYGNFTFFIVKSIMKQKQNFIIRKKITIKVNRHSLQESIPERALCPTCFFLVQSSFAGRPLAISCCPDLEDHNFGSRQEKSGAAGAQFNTGAQRWPTCPHGHAIPHLHGLSGHLQTLSGKHFKHLLLAGHPHLVYG